MKSTCCDAPIFISIETPICTQCKEHCDIKEEKEEVIVINDDGQIYDPTNIQRGKNEKNAK